MTLAATIADRCFRATMSWKRWKSVRDARFFLAASFFAQEDASHLARTSASSQALFSVFCRAFLGILTTMSVSATRLKGMTWRATPVFVAGPSTRHLLPSTMSMIVASLPSSGP